MRLKGYRTIAANVILGLLPSWEVLVLIAQEVARSQELHSIMPKEWMPYYMLFVAAVNIYLRAITTTPVGRKD